MREDPKFSDPQKPCSGCAHSAAHAKFPGHPSGERPCGFCVRNPELKDGEVANWFGEGGPRWYDGKTPPHKAPMDCYIATDRLTQQRIFNELERLKQSGKKAPERAKFPAGMGKNKEDVYCCEGGPAPGGHKWTCWGWLGITFG